MAGHMKKWRAALAVGLTTMALCVLVVSPEPADAKFGVGFGGGSRAGRGLGSRFSGQVGSARQVRPTKMNWEKSARPGSPVARERFQKRSSLSIQQRIVIHRTFSERDPSTSHVVYNVPEPEAKRVAGVVYAPEPGGMFRDQERVANTLMLWAGASDAFTIASAYPEGGWSEKDADALSSAFDRAKRKGAYASLMSEDARGDLVRAIAASETRAVVLLGDLDASRMLRLADGKKVAWSWLERTCAQYHTTCAVVGWGDGESAWPGTSGAQAAAKAWSSVRAKLADDASAGDVVAALERGVARVDGLTLLLTRRQ